ncbi:MAG TPA: hypothetical protein VGN22_20860, partial [Pseudonocardia sp.]
DLPEEWGVIVIPDDLSELSDEVEAIRAELKLSDRSTPWRRLLNRPGLRQLRKVGTALLRAPVLIISMAVLVTVASLFASAWPGPPRQPVAQRTGDEHLGSLPALELVGDDGRMVPLRAKLPAVILVTDGCDCDNLVATTVTATQSRPEIAIVVIGAALSGAATAKASTPAAQVTPATQTTPQTSPRAQVPGQSVQLLHNPPSNNVREQLKLGAPDGTAAALVVDRNGQIVQTIQRTASVDDIQPFLARI